MSIETKIYQAMQQKALNSACEYVLTPESILIHKDFNLPIFVEPGGRFTGFHQNIPWTQDKGKIVAKFGFCFSDPEILSPVTPLEIVGKVSENRLHDGDPFNLGKYFGMLYTSGDEAEVLKITLWIEDSLLWAKIFNYSGYRFGSILPGQKPSEQIDDLVRQIKRFTNPIGK